MKYSVAIYYLLLSSLTAREIVKFPAQEFELKWQTATGLPAGSLPAGDKFKINLVKRTSKGIYVSFGEGDIASRFDFRCVPAIPDVAKLSDLSAAHEFFLILGEPSIRRVAGYEWSFISINLEENAKSVVMVVIVDFDESNSLDEILVGTGEVTLPELGDQEKLVPR